MDNNLRREWIRRVLWTDQRNRSEANVEIIFNALKLEMIITEDIIQDAIAQNQSRLAINPEYAEAFSQFFAIYRGFATEANQQVLTNHLRQKDQDVTLQALNRIVSNEQEWLKANLTMSASWKAEQELKAAEAKRYEEEQAEAEQLQEELLQKYFRDDGSGNFVRGDRIPQRYEDEKKRLSQTSVPELRELVRQKREKERIDRMTPEEYRRSINAQTTTQKLQELYQGRFITPDPRGYQIPGSISLDNPEGRFVPWTSVLSLLNKGLISPDDIRACVRRHGKELFEAACQGVLHQ